MARFAALLRGINVGGHTVKMEVLKAEFEALGFDDVSTVIASGNVLLTGSGGAGALEKRIEARLKKALGYEVATFLRTGPQLAKAVREAGALATGGRTAFVGFLHTAPSPAAKTAVAALETDLDTLVPKGRELYWVIKGGFSDSKIKAGAIERALGPMTVRSATTVAKLAERLKAARG